MGKCKEAEEFLTMLLPSPPKTKLCFSWASCLSILWGHEVEWGQTGGGKDGRERMNKRWQEVKLVW